MSSNTSLTTLGEAAMTTDSSTTGMCQSEQIRWRMTRGRGHNRAPTGLADLWAPTKGTYGLTSGRGRQPIDTHDGHGRDEDGPGEDLSGRLPATWRGVRSQRQVHRTRDLVPWRLGRLRRISPFQRGDPRRKCHRRVRDAAALAQITAQRHEPVRPGGPQVRSPTDR
jgi:hypothetical protein